MIMKNWHSYFSKILLFRERHATSVNYTSVKAAMFIPFFTVSGFPSSSSELDSSELGFFFFAGAFLAGVAEISYRDDHEKRHAYFSKMLLFHENFENQKKLQCLYPSLLLQVLLPLHLNLTLQNLTPFFLVEISLLIP